MQLKCLIVIIEIKMQCLDLKAQITEMKNPVTRSQWARKKTHFSSILRYKPFVNEENVKGKLLAGNPRQSIKLEAQEKIDT